MTVKVVSGWSMPGGSTMAHIALTNLLNENGIETIFYGPQDWHINKCNGRLISSFMHDNAEDDILICHFIGLNVLNEIKAKKKILYCHETNLFPLKEIDLTPLDLIVYVSNDQKKYHSVNFPNVIIPPVVEKIKWSASKNNIAGVLGNIDRHKQQHISIERALHDGYDKVLLFGVVTDLSYFNEKISPHINSGKAVLRGHVENKEALYNSINRVYQSSKRETFGLVYAECKISKIPIDCLDSALTNGEILEKEEILDKWKRVIYE